MKSIGIITLMILIAVGTASEVIRAGLRLLEAQEIEFQSKQEKLRNALIAGENSGDSDLQIDNIIAIEKVKPAAV